MKQTLFRHHSQIRHQSLQTPVGPFLATLSREKLFLKHFYQLKYIIS